MRFKTERRELKDETKLDLLPMAFTKQDGMWVWVDLLSVYPGHGHKCPKARR